MHPVLSQAVTNDDFQAVHTLIERYAWAVDDYDVEGVIACFAPDARFVSADMALEGHEALRSFFASALGDGAAGKTSTHLMANISVVARSPDRCDVRTAAVVYHAASDSGASRCEGSRTPTYAAGPRRAGASSSANTDCVGRASFPAALLRRSPDHFDPKEWMSYAACAGRPSSAGLILVAAVSPRARQSDEHRHAVRNPSLRRR